MKVSKAEYLSALVDDEAGEFEGRRMVEELSKNAGDRGLWARYHLIGEALRGGLPPMIDTGLASRISAALDAEAPLHISHKHGLSDGGRRLAKPLVGFAMAAGVAVVSVVSLQTLTVTGTDEADTVSVQLAVETAAPVTVPVAATQVAATVPATVPSVPSVPHVPSAEAAARMNSYLVNHAEYGSPQQAMLPQVRIVGYSQSQD